MTGMAQTVTAVIIDFVTAMPGFPTARRWTLEPWGGEDSPLTIMCSEDVADLEFVVVPPGVFFPDYTAELDDATVRALGIESAEDVVLLVILTLGDSPQTTTANLLGPIVINSRTNRAAQAILHQPGLSTKVPLA